MTNKYFYHCKCTKCGKWFKRVSGMPGRPRTRCYKCSPYRPAKVTIKNIEAVLAMEWS